MSSLRLLRPYASTNTPNSTSNDTHRSNADSQTCPPSHTAIAFAHAPWKQSRYSTFCGALDTWMMEMGKLWEEAANTAEANVTSFLSRNSEHTHTSGQFSSRSRARQTLVYVDHLTFQHVLLHLDLIELIGADDDAVSREVDAAAGFRRLDLLRRRAA